MNLSALREALEPLTQFGQDEFSFKIPSGDQEVEVILRPLLPFEETECQTRSFQVIRQAQEGGEVDPDEGIDRATATSYLDMFRAEVISYALVKIGNQNFRGVKTVQTGRVLENGVAESIPLHAALRGIILDSWSRSMLSICFSKYGDLVAQIARKADRVVSSSLTEIDAEIERTKKRLETLLAEREKRAKGDPGATLDHVKTLIDYGDRLEQELEETVKVADEQRKLRDDIAEIRRKAEAGEPQEEAPQEPAEPKPQEPKPQEPKPQEPKPQEPKPQSRPAQPETPRQSLVPDHVPPPTSVPTQQERVERARQAVVPDYGGVNVAQATPEGTVPGRDGKPVEAYRLPSETISQRGRGPGGRGAKPPEEAPSDPRRGTENPHFKPRKG